MDLTQPAGATVAGSSTPTTPASPLVTRFASPQSHPPASYYALVGRGFATYVNTKKLVLGRSHGLAGDLLPDTKEPTLSLGDHKVISRTHLEIEWNPKQMRWILHAVGKNGFWVGPNKVSPLTTKDESATSSSLSTLTILPSDCIALSRTVVSQIRIGVGEQTFVFFFMPSVPVQRKPRAPKAATSGTATSTGGGGGGSESKKKEQAEKKRKNDSTSANEETTTKKRKKPTTLASNEDSKMDADDDESVPLADL